MCGKHMSQFDIVCVIELHKIGKTNCEIGCVTGIPEKRVSALARKWCREGCKGIPLHKHGSGPAIKVSDNTLSVIKWELSFHYSKTIKRTEPFPTEKCINLYDSEKCTEKVRLPKTEGS